MRFVSYILLLLFLTTRFDALGSTRGRITDTVYIDGIEKAELCSRANKWFSLQQQGLQKTLIRYDRTKRILFGKLVSFRTYESCHYRDYLDVKIHVRKGMYVIVITAVSFEESLARKLEKERITELPIRSKDSLFSKKIATEQKEGKPTEVSHQTFEECIDKIERSLKVVMTTDHT